MMGIVLSNLRYAVPDNAVIDMDVAGVIEGETIPFTYRADDTAPLTEAITALLADGEYEIAAYEEPDASPPPKLKASARQIRLALNILELRTAIENYVAAADQSVKDSWEYTTEFEEDHQFIKDGQVALSIPDETVRDIFTLAGTL